MCNNFPNIRITEGNNFSLVLPLRSRTYVATKPIDEDIDPEQLENVVVTFGGVEYPAQRTAQGVQIDLPATLAVGTYNILLTAEYMESSIRAAYESAVTIVPWSAQSTAEQYIAGSPIVMRAAYVLSCVLTDAELEALKEEYREKIAEAEQAKEEAEEAKAEWEQKAAELDGVAQEATLTQGVQNIRADISHIDIDTTTLAKEVQVKDGNDTAISVGKEVRSELGTGSDTAAETGTLFAVVKWIKDKVKSIFDFIGTPASGQPGTLFAAIAAGGGGSFPTDYAKQGTNPDANISDIQEQLTQNILSYAGGGVQIPNAIGQELSPINILSHSSEVVSIEDNSTIELFIGLRTSIATLFPNIVEFKATRAEIMYHNNTYAFYSTTKLLNVDLSKVRILDNPILIFANSKIRRIDLSNFKSYTGALDRPFSGGAGSPDIIDIVTGANITTNTSIFATWNPTNALSTTSTSLLTPEDIEAGFTNNREKLLYNIREHFAANLQDRTGMTSLILSMSANIKAAILADQPTADAFTNKNWTIA